MADKIIVVADVYVTIRGQDYGYDSDPNIYQNVHSGMLRLESRLTQKEIRKEKSVEEYFRLIATDGIKQNCLTINFGCPRQITDIEAEVRFLWRRMSDDALLPLYQEEAQDVDDIGQIFRHVLR